KINVNYFPTRRSSDLVGLNCDKVDKVLGSRKFSSMVRDDEDEAEQMDVQGVPFFVFNETYAVSGVQSVEAFTEVINAVWKEENRSEEHTSELQSRFDL